MPNIVILIVVIIIVAASIGIWWYSNKDVRELKRKISEKQLLTREELLALTPRQINGLTLDDWMLFMETQSKDLTIRPRKVIRSSTSEQIAGVTIIELLMLQEPEVLELDSKHPSSMTPLQKAAINAVKKLKK